MLADTRPAILPMVAQQEKVRMMGGPWKAVAVAALGAVFMAILLQVAASAPDVLEYVERRNAERLQREKEEFYKTHAFSFAK